jgi:hypothetical protein
MRAKLTAVLRFWYDFVVGDDWRIAVAVIVGLGVTFGVSRASIPSWWVLPAIVAALRPVSVWRVARLRASRTDTADE